MYRITEYTGDFAVANQAHWGDEYVSVLEAIRVAKKVYNDRYLIMNDKSYHVLVETIAPYALPKDVLAFTMIGQLVGEELDRFLYRFD